MLHILNKLGSKITEFCKEPSISRDLFSQDPLSYFLPWIGYDEPSRIFIGKNTLGFTIECIPLVGSAQVASKEISSIFQEILEEGDSFQCLLLADHRVEPFLARWEKARKESEEIYQEIAHRRAQFLQNSQSINSRIFRFILSYNTESQWDSLKVEKIKEKKEKILKTLKNLTYAFVWDVKDFLQTTGSLINFSIEKDVKKRNWNPYQELSSQLPTGGCLNVEKNYLQWEKEEKVCLKTFRAVDYPDFWSLADMQRLIGDVFKDAFRITSPFYLHYGIHCPSQAKEEGKFKRRSHLIEKQGRSSLLMRMIPALSEELRESDIVRKELVQASKFVWTQFSAGIFEKMENLATAEQSIKSLFRINQFTLVENQYLHFPAFLAALPMTWGEYAQDLKELNLLRTTLNTECGSLVPIQGEWMGTKTPGMLLIGRRGQLINWNPFDNKAGNYNTVVVGRSGSGKSVFMQDLLLSKLGVGAKVFILEVGRSFEKLCDLLHGQYIEFSKESNICLNPFSNVSTQDSESTDTSISFLKSIISCMAAPEKGTSDYENALIEKAIRYAWNSKRHKATITDVAYWLQSHADESAKMLGIMLTPYTKEGIYAKYFEGDNNVDFTSPMVLIELEELKEKKDLQSVVLQLFIMTITNQTFLGDRKTPFFICIDEAWDLLRGKQTGLFIETLARRLRKYFGALIIGTQSVDDFYSTPGALAAFENSDWMCMLAQKKSSIARFAESGKVEMDDAKRYALESVTTRHGEYSEVMICDADGNYSIARLVLDPFSQLLYTTKAQEYTQIKELQNQGLTISQAINRLIGNEKH